ncbi:hypothetical protein LSH36_305g02022 [Paralvinella palmiformis]|uniref:Uncharacterized protein n=1 Tax=Paralvinella palmiformis TaxID=53620 RepID=A0AAD9N3Q4_9ANNE|nr:hypothetical protein LSH36_305g02022 [Paralvinella palmiformis]
MFQLIPWIFVCLLTYFLLDWYRRQPRIVDLSRKFILITGCDTGFGKLLVQRLDAIGCNVFAGCLTQAGQVDLRSVCSPRVKTLTLDVTQPDGIQKAFDLVANTAPPEEGLWALVNNAGIPGVSAGPLEWLSADDFRKTLEVNVIGLIDVTLTFLPLLKKAGGRVVNMSSTGGRLAGPYSLPCDVSKFGVEGFSDGLRRHLRLYDADVSVHVIEPSLFRTDMVDPERHSQLFQATWRRLPQRTKDEFGESFYKEYSRHSIEAIHNASSTEYSKVLDVYVHALTSMRPRLRYTVGYRAMFFSIPLSYLPSNFVDWIICKVHPTLERKGALRKGNGPYVHVNRNVRFSTSH